MQPRWNWPSAWITTCSIRSTMPWRRTPLAPSLWYYEKAQALGRIAWLAELRGRMLQRLNSPSWPEVLESFGVWHISLTADTMYRILLRDISMGRIDHETEEAVRRFLALIASRYDMAGAIVYGSRARGTHRPDSDADVAAAAWRAPAGAADDAGDGRCGLRRVVGNGDQHLAAAGMMDEWEHPERFSNPALLHDIAQEGVRL